MPEPFSPILRIAKYTVADEVKQRSAVVMFVILAILVFSVRGCFKGTYMVNGQMLDPETITLKLSQAIFHLIAAFSIFITALISMRVLRRDRDEGVQACIMSRPIERWQYLAGKILGLWFLVIVFMFILHGIVFVIASMNMGTVMPRYLIASLLCFLNLFLVVVATLLLTIFLPEMVALPCILGIGIASWVIDGIYALSNSRIFQAMVHPGGVQQPSDLTLGKVAYFLWPKLSGTQHWASAMIGNNVDYGYMSLYPFINVLAYCFIIGILLFRRFKKADIV